MSELAQTQKQPLPPYVPYRTFTTFLDSLKVGIPSHIDKSVMRSFSGGMQSWLKASLRTMKLMNAESVPQERLKQLVSAEGENRKAILRDLFNATYAPLLKGKIDLTTTTPQKLRSAFVELGAQGETVDKCMAFLVAMAKDAGFSLSPHLTMRASPKPRTKRQAPRAESQKSDETLGSEKIKKASTDATPDASEAMTQALLAKFPSFDPAWPAEVQAKWFDGFDRLMKAAKV